MRRFPPFAGPRRNREVRLYRAIRCFGGSFRTLIEHSRNGRDRLIITLAREPTSRRTKPFFRKGLARSREVCPRRSAGAQFNPNS